MPGSDAHQNLVQLYDEFGFGIILTYKGCKNLVGKEAYLAHKKSRERVPKPPKIQELLKTAISLKKGFSEDPNRTKTMAARELGISPRRVGQIMNLLKLKPKMQRYILNLPPSIGRGPLTGRGLRPELSS
ncbi:hypothetical protein ACFL6Y_10640 [Elusimicrobiota bacterium]